MIKKNIYKFISSDFSCHESDIKTISNNHGVGFCISSQKVVYDFDEICKSLLPSNKLLSSVDGIGFANNTIDLIELKSGFKQNINRNSYNPAQSLCPSNKEIVCLQYWELFDKVRQLEQKQLVDSIKHKALESYYILDKIIMPQCEDCDSQKLRLTVVIDVESSEAILDIISSVAETPQVTNWRDRIIKALSKFRNLFYDDIRVFVAEEYEAILNHNKH